MDITRAMDLTERIGALRREGALLADAAAAADLAAPVPGCPGWELRDLVVHTGKVHRWATSYLVHGHRSPLDQAGQLAAWGPEPSDAALVDWFREGHADLSLALEKAPAELDCWSFLPAPSPVAFWARRQLHETAVHRFDAEAAAGVDGPRVTAEVALDGIDELLRGFLVRPQGRLRSPEPRTVLVRATDAERPEGLPSSWRVTISQDPVTVTLTDEAADLVLTGSAHDLYLLLWNRRPIEAADASGDLTLLDLWRERAVIRSG
ncbi:maleylpyruvate isomerase family mycothiol-dependent enzyme [Kitasatospora sp. NPDC054939]